MLDFYRGYLEALQEIKETIDYRIDHYEKLLSNAMQDLHDESLKESKIPIERVTYF